MKLRANQKIRRSLTGTLLAVSVLSVTLTALSVPFPTQAQSLNTTLGETLYHIEQTFAVPVFISSPSQSVNAFSVKVTFPAESLRFLGSDEKDSIIGLWVEKPRLERGAVVFSGIMPNGFTDAIDPLTGTRSSGFLTNLIFVGHSQGKGTISAKAELYANDGLGTPLVSSGFDVIVAIDWLTLPSDYEITDFEKPEPFTLSVARHASIHDGKYALYFETTDRGSGIDHYQVREGWAEWKRGESPYLLTDQSLRSLLSVKAVDKAGNERIATLPAPNPHYPPKSFPWSMVLGLIGIVSLLLWSKIRKKDKYKSIVDR